MTTQFRITSALAAVALAFSAAANADTPGGPGIDKTVQHIVDTLTEQGLEIVLLVDHAAAADSVGLPLNPTKVIFARQSRALEGMLLRRSATAGIDLPLKFLVFEDDASRPNIRVNTVGYIVDRHNIEVRDFVLKALDNRVTQFSTPDTGLVTVASSQGLQATADALVDAISQNPAFRIPLVLDYSERNAADDARSGTRGPVLVVFGNPTVGTPLMQSSQEIALDLPQKFLVWQRDDEVFISYNDPFFIGRRHNVQDQDDRLAMIATALANFAAAAAGN